MEEQMRIYRYYDKINGKNVYLKVTDEVAKFLQNSYKQWQRQQEECYEHNISLNKVLYEDDDDNPITLEDVVPDRTDEEIQDFCERCFRNQKLYRLVWKMVEKLTEKQQKLVDDIYVYDKSQSEIAEELGVSDSAVSQAHDTVILHLAFYFYSDEEFQETDLYKRNQREFEYALKQVAIEIFKRIAEENGLKINLNAVRKLTKNNTQFLKLVATLKGKLPEAEKKRYTHMNRTVKHTLDEMNLDWSKENILTVPTDLKLPENTEQIIKELTKKMSKKKKSKKKKKKKHKKR